MSYKIATQAEAAKIGGGTASEPKRLCTSNKAEELGCKVASDGHFEHKQVTATSSVHHCVRLANLTKKVPTVKVSWDTKTQKGVSIQYCKFYYSGGYTDTNGGTANSPITYVVITFKNTNPTWQDETTVTVFGNNTATVLGTFYLSPGNTTTKSYSGNYTYISFEGEL